MKANEHEGLESIHTADWPTPGPVSKNITSPDIRDLFAISLAPAFLAILNEGEKDKCEVMRVVADGAYTLADALMVRRTKE